ncbi:hypothetical protein V6N13_121539 [Hibiscus sabdariffa]
MTQDEFIAAHTGYNKMQELERERDNPTMSKSTLIMYEKLSDVPTSFDWRDQGAVTPQKRSKPGCNGGWMMDAFEYITQNQGITTEQSYPYEGKQETCDSEKHIDKVATINGYQMVPANDEEALLKAVANQPVSVALDSRGRNFQFYTGTGVFTGECDSVLTHGVTIVGYGTSEEGLKYWVIKNSWGKTWGENGFMKIQRGVNAPGGLCGIARMPRIQWYNFM